MVLGGPTASGMSHLERKKYACSINTRETPKKKPQREDHISFSEEDMKGVGFPHSDVIVITINVEEMRFENFGRQWKFLLHTVPTYLL